MGRGGQLSWDDYSANWATLHQGVDPRRASRYVRWWLRIAYLIGRTLAAIGVRPGAVTVTGLLSSAAVPVVAILGGPWLFLAAGLVFVAAIADSTDGAVAVIASRATPLGSFYDSVADRIGEAAWLTALWLLGAPGWLVVACGGFAWLHEYARARAAVAGMTGIGAITVAERPTRIIVVICALVLGGFAWFVDPRLTAGAVTVAASVWLVLSLLAAPRLMGAIRTDLQRQPHRRS